MSGRARPAAARRSRRSGAGCRLGAGADRVHDQRLLDEGPALDQRSWLTLLLEDPAAGRVGGAEPSRDLEAGRVVAAEAVADTDQREPGPIARLGRVVQRDPESVRLLPRCLDVVLQLVALALHQVQRVELRVQDSPLVMQELRIGRPVLPMDEVLH